MGTIFGVEKRRLRDIQRDMKKGAPFTELTQAEQDALHSKPNEENLVYWNSEREKAVETDDLERILVCDSARRFMLLVTVPHVDDDIDDILGHTLEKFENLPKGH